MLMFTAKPNTTDKPLISIPLSAPPSKFEIPSDLDEPLLVLFGELVVAVPVYHGTREPAKLVTGRGVTGEIAIHYQANFLGDGLSGTRAT